MLFRGTGNVALATMADGEHIIAIQQAGQVVACGVILELASASPALPMTGATAFSLVAAIAAFLGLCALSVGLFPRQRNRSAQPSRTS